MKLPTWEVVGSMQDDYWRLGSGVVHRTCIGCERGRTVGVAFRCFTTPNARTNEKVESLIAAGVCYARHMVCCQLFRVGDMLSGCEDRVLVPAQAAVAVWDKMRVSSLRGEKARQGDCLVGLGHLTFPFPLPSRVHVSTAEWTRSCVLFRDPIHRTSVRRGALHLTGLE